MAEETPKKKTHKEWRKEVKKLRRKKIRQRLAEERNKKAAEEEASRLNDSEYQSWLREQNALEDAQLEQEELERQQQEELWMRRELLAEKQFREQQRKHEATLAVKEAERLRIQKEFQELQEQAQKRREERKQREEQAKLEHEQMMQRISEYIELGGTIPQELTSNVQSNPSKPICPFFSKTNACRFRMHCCRNHIRPKLSKILFFPNFFTHIKLEQSDAECGSDIGLEYTENQLRIDYNEFFEDVTSELKKFGEIENFRTCMNTQTHLRGNVLVEYSTEREALKAYMELQGRYYASRQINVEFSSIVTWKSAICGLSYTRKCPKGRDCNFLHIFKNPDNLYNISVFKQGESMKKTSRHATRDNSVMSWNDGDDRSSKRNWRWSESPEPDPICSTNGDKKSTEVNANKRKESSLCSRRSNPSTSGEKSSSHRSRVSSLHRSERNRSSERYNQTKSRERSSSYRSRESSGKNRSSERKSKHHDRYKKSKSRDRSPKCSSKDSRQNGNSSSQREEKRRSKSKTSESPKKRKHRKEHHKEKKHKHRSKRSRS